MLFLHQSEIVLCVCVCLMLCISVKGFTVLDLFHKYGGSIFLWNTTFLFHWYMVSEPPAPPNKRNWKLYGDHFEILKSYTRHYMSFVLVNWYLFVIINLMFPLSNLYLFSTVSFWCISVCCTFQVSALQNLL